MAEPSLREILDAVQAVSSKLTLIESQVLDLRSDRDDHEKRLRTVEQRTDMGRRLDALEVRVTQHDAAFSKLSERIGSAEMGQINLEKQAERAATPKVHPVAYVSVVLSALSIVIVTVIAVSGI